MKLKIISDGTPLGTTVVNAETGEVVSGVYKIEYILGVDSVSFCRITIRSIPLEFVGDAIVVQDQK